MTIDAGRLRAQLVPLDWIPTGAGDLLGDMGGGLVLRGVTAGPSGPQPVNRTDVDRSGSDSSPMQTAVRQTFEQELRQLDVRDHEAGGVRFRALAIDGSPYVSTTLVSPGVAADLPGVEDFLVAAPRLSLVMVRPILGRQDIGLARALRAAAGIVFENPDRCSPDVFWWREGRCYPLHIDDDLQEVLVDPALTDRLAALPD